jgi:hypothetical protein
MGENFVSSIRSRIIVLVAKEWPEKAEFWPLKADAVSKYTAILVIRRREI